MGRQIKVELSQVACLHAERSRWPNRILFALAALADGPPLAALVGPHWMVNGERWILDPPVGLLAAETGRPGIGVAVAGVELGPDGPWDDRPLARELVLATIRRRLSLLPPPPEPGAAWDRGLLAVEEGLAERLARSARRIFHFSKVYEVRDSPQTFTLSHSVGDGDGGICARYKLVLGLSSRVVAPSLVATENHRA